MTTAIDIQRTPDVIAAEINGIKSQTREIVLFNSIKIGQYLVEAKSMMEHGDWGTWLAESVDYSKSTANNLMRIFEVYGSALIEGAEQNDINNAISKLSYTSAAALLSIPKEKRDMVILSLHEISGKMKYINEMSLREVLSIVKKINQPNEYEAPYKPLKPHINCDICSWGGEGLEDALISYQMRDFTIVKNGTITDVDMAMLCPNCLSIIDILKRSQDEEKRKTLSKSLGDEQMNKIKNFFNGLKKQLREVI